MQKKTLSLAYSALQVKNVIFGLLIFFNCEKMSVFKDVPASIYDRKTEARPFATTNDILRHLSLVQSLLKDRNALKA